MEAQPAFETCSCLNTNETEVHKYTHISLIKSSSDRNNLVLWYTFYFTSQFPCCVVPWNMQLTVPHPELQFNVIARISVHVSAYLPNFSTHAQTQSVWNRRETYLKPASWLRCQATFSPCLASYRRRAARRNEPSFKLFPQSNFQTRQCLYNMSSNTHTSYKFTAWNLRRNRTSEQRDHWRTAFSLVMVGQTSRSFKPWLQPHIILRRKKNPNF